MRKYLFLLLIDIIFVPKIKTMSKVEFEPLILTDTTDIFTIRIDDEKETEYRKFFVMFKDTKDSFLKEDLERILAAIEKIAVNGALESFFRVEGKMKDRICAIPLLIKPRDKSKHGTLRLYCIRVSNNLLIIGGGGLKVSDKYQENDVLAKHVSTLQAIDSKLKELEKGGADLNSELFNVVIEID